MNKDSNGELPPTRRIQNGGHSLAYIRPAMAFRDVSDGYLYHHDWATGFQSLVFPTHQAARDWLTTQQHDKDTAAQDAANDI